MSDLIDRKEAIDALERSKKIYFDRQVIIGAMKDIVRNLPSAQPEIIRCRECKEWEMYGNGCQGWCGKLGLISYDDDYCGWAERREVSK